MLDFPALNFDFFWLVFMLAGRTDLNDTEDIPYT